jgi:hypothetical protein
MRHFSLFGGNDVSKINLSNAYPTLKNSAPSAVNVFVMIQI